MIEFKKTLKIKMLISYSLYLQYHRFPRLWNVIYVQQRKYVVENKRFQGEPEEIIDHKLHDINREKFVVAMKGRPQNPNIFDSSKQSASWRKTQNC